MNILGIDISKLSFDVALLIDGKIKSKQYRNNSHGFAALCRWLTNKNISKVHACLEATGTYGEALATYLYKHGHIVSVVNPAKIKGFAQSSLSRNKTDKADAKIIAHFCKALKPAPWQPTPQHIMHLQALLKRLDELQDMHQQELNRLSSNPQTSKYIKKHVSYLSKEIEKMKTKIFQHIEEHKDLKESFSLISTIPGIGDLTSVKLVAAVIDISRFENPKQLAAYFGLSPKNNQSGTSINGKTRLSKIGNADIRKALYFPAISAIKHNPVIKEFAKRLTGLGKAKMAIICASMRKLIHMAFGILKSQKPFDVKAAVTKVCRIPFANILAGVNGAKRQRGQQCAPSKKDSNNNVIQNPLAIIAVPGCSAG